MNRVNFGNITTNALQTLSVAGTTYANIKRRSLAQADNALNNLTDEERQQYREYQANEMRDKIREYNEQNEEQSIDDILGLKDNSTQMQNISKKINNDIEYSKSRKSIKLNVDKDTGNITWKDQYGNTSIKDTKGRFVSRGGNVNANV